MGFGIEFEERKFNFGFEEVSEVVVKRNRRRFGIGRFRGARVCLVKVWADCSSP